MSQIQCIVREVLAKADKHFVEEVLVEAETQETLGNYKAAESLLNEAILIADFHETRMALAA